MTTRRPADRRPARKREASVAGADEEKAEVNAVAQPGFTPPPRFSGILVARRYVDLQRVNSALCS